MQFLCGLNLSLQNTNFKENGGNKTDNDASYKLYYICYADKAFMTTFLTIYSFLPFTVQYICTKLLYGFIRI